MKPIPVFTCGLLAVLAAGLLAPSGLAAQGTASTPKSSMMKAYHAYKAAWNRHDVPAIVAYYEVKGSLSNPAAGGVVSGPALAAWLQGTFAAIPDFKVEGVTAEPISERRLLEQWVIKGTWTQPFPGGPLAGATPTGKSFAVPGAGIFEWKDGKIVAGTHYFDQMAFLTQIGVIGQK